MEPDHVKYPERFAKITTDEKYLRKPSKQVDVQDSDSVKQIRLQLAELQEILVVKEPWYEDYGIIGYGLAACQLKRIADEGIEAPRAGIVRIPSASGKHLFLNMINPQIMDLKHPFRYKAEGCLSFPGTYMTTKRFRAIKLGFIDADSLEPREMVLHGIEAVVLQHEVDHHDGILYTDRHQKPTERVGTKLKPNDPCICGSGKKVKKCDCGAYT